MILDRNGDAETTCLFGRHGSGGVSGATSQLTLTLFPVRRLNMVRILKTCFIFSVLLLLLTGLVWADSGQNFLNTPHGKFSGTTGNGFPKGNFYKMNVIGKKGHCPQPETQGESRSGKVVFIPSSGAGMILIQSGVGADPEVTGLQVTDACSGFDGTPAVVQLPANELGYRVFMRNHGKPGGEIKITPQLVSAEDDAGNDLVSLGLLTDNGFLTPVFSSSRGRFKKFDKPGSNGGKPNALDATGLFTWNGTECNFSPASCDPIESCTETSYCCADTNSDGAYDTCAVNEGSCGEGSSEVTAYCQSFADAPVFSISDFVTYGWQIENNGIYNFEVRFYPVTQ